MDLLIHGIHDAQTLTTIRSKSSARLGFDLRARSPQLVPFSQLLEMIPHLKGDRFHIMFGEDRESTILSFLDLLKNFKQQVVVEFRDSQKAEFYHKIGHDFYWYFNPAGDWKNIVQLPTLKGLILPTEWRAFYQTTSSLWDIIEQRQLDVYLQPSTVEELEDLATDQSTRLSFDLNQEVESGYRKVDQERLRKLKIWRMNEDSVGQR